MISELSEIENVGIRKHGALDELTAWNKIVLLVTHDPVVALRSDFRTVMRNEAMTEIVETTGREREVIELLERVNT
ncbi:hypothetical protein [Methanopyrus sp.]